MEEKDSNRSDEATAVLREMARSAGIPFDGSRAAEAMRAAVRDHPPTEARASRQRVIQAAASLGMDVVSRSYSAREALGVVAKGASLAIFAIVPGGTGRWFVLKEARAGQARLAKIEPSDPDDDWRDAAGIAALVGADGVDAVLDWHLAQPAAPLAEAGPAGGAERLHDDGHHLPPLRRLVGLLQPERSDLWIVLLFAVGVGLFTLTTPIVAMAVVNTAALGTLVQQLIVLCGALFVALTLAGTLQFLQAVVVEFIQRRVFVRVAADLAYRLPRVDVTAFDRRHGPELVNRFFDVLTVQKAGATLLLDGVTIALQVFLGLLLLGYYHVYLLGFDLVLVAALCVLLFVLGRGAVKTAVTESINKFAVAGWMEEIARHPVAFKLSGGPQFARDRTDALTRDYLVARKAHFRVLMRQFAFALFLQAAANVALLGIGGWLVVEGRLTLGELVAAEIVVTLVVATFAKLGKQLESYYDLLAAVDKLGHLVDLPLERDGGSVHQAMTKGASVDVRDLKFNYEGLGRDVISHLSFRLEPGERAALVGPNGAGKSTLVDVLFGLRVPAGGWVEIDGADLRELKLDTLRRHAAVVKGVELFEGSVMDNVRMGRDEVTVPDVREALRKVGLLETLMEFPDGLETQLGTGGSPLSLGQANRLMIARAIAGRPRLLILDEALDHMDNELRQSVLPAVMGPDAHWTLLVVTHSPETAAACDRVIEITRTGKGGTT